MILNNNLLPTSSPSPSINPQVIQVFRRAKGRKEGWEGGGLVGRQRKELTPHIRAGTISEKHPPLQLSTWLYNMPQAVLT